MITRKRNGPKRGLEQAEDWKLVAFCYSCSHPVFSGKGINKLGMVILWNSRIICI